jgi:hypothetical protein
VAEVGRRFLLDPTLPGEVVAVDPPHRLGLVLRSPEQGDAEMTWVVEPAPGGCAVRVIVTPSAAVTDTVAGALRNLFDEGRRAMLRTRSPVLIQSRPRPASSPSAVTDEPSPVVDGPSPVADGPSQALSVWPVLRRRPRSGRRRTGVSLALRLVGVAAIAAVLGAITLGPPSIPWAKAPDVSTPSDTAARRSGPTSGSSSTSCGCPWWGTATSWAGGTHGSGSNRPAAPRTFRGRAGNRPQSRPSPFQVLRRPFPAVRRPVQAARRRPPQVGHRPPASP